MRRLILATTAAVALTLLATSAASATADDIRVIDGDTIEINGMPIRILSIDTPETWKPRCANEYRLGLRAKARMQQLVDSGDVTYKVAGFDRFGRILADVFAGKLDVGETLLNEGYALPYVAGPVAKAQRLNVWCPKELP